MVDTIRRDQDTDEREGHGRTGSGSVTASRPTGSLRDRARSEAELRATRTKRAFARRAFGVLEEYFPEEARSRRRRQGTTAVLVGLAAGILLRHLVD
jgi:hypothetical protein